MGEIKEMVLPLLALGRSAISISRTALSSITNLTPEKLTELLVFAHNSPIGQVGMQMGRIIKKEKSLD